MSTITKELAKLFRKITNSEIDAEGNAHVVLSPADSLLINNARIALASLEAEPVAYMHHSGQVMTREGCCDDKIFAICCKVETPLYAAPQLPQPAPEEIAMQNFRAAMEGIGHILRTLEETFGGLHGTHCEPDVLVECKEVCDAIYEAYRKTAQVTPDGWQLVPKEPTAAMNKAGWDAMNEHDAINPTYRAMLAAAPRHEVQGE